MDANIFVGTAGWAIPMLHAPAFPDTGTTLSRYASIFNAAEINSTFYRSHRPATFERWRDSVPDPFRFAVKVPKTVTHELRLVDAGPTFAGFVSSLSGLGNRLGPLLLQLPPKLEFDARVADAFLKDALAVTSAALVIEPRHPSWFSDEAEALLAGFGVARAGADPERCPGALQPGGARDLTYLRLHGSPRVYFSAYEDAFLEHLVIDLRAAPKPAWCIFDNTASGAAAGNALGVCRLLASA